MASISYLQKQYKKIYRDLICDGITALLGQNQNPEPVLRCSPREASIAWPLTQESGHQLLSHVTVTKSSCINICLRVQFRDLKE